MDGHGKVRSRGAYSSDKDQFTKNWLEKTSCFNKQIEGAAGW
jgi:hypothetical protein